MRTPVFRDALRKLCGEAGAWSLAAAGRGRMPVWRLAGDLRATMRTDRGHLSPELASVPGADPAEAQERSVALENLVAAVEELERPPASRALRAVWGKRGEERLTLLRSMLSHGDDETLEAAAICLDDPDADVVSAALSAVWGLVEDLSPERVLSLSWHACPRVRAAAGRVGLSLEVDDLAEALGSGEARLRRAAARVCEVRSAIREPVPVEELVGAAEDGDVEVRLRVAHALGGVLPDDGEAAAEGLLVALGDASARVRRVACDSLARAAFRDWLGQHAVDVEAALVERSRKDADVAVRRAATEALGMVGTADVAGAALRDGAGAEDPVVRGTALAGLGAVVGEAAVAGLGKAMKDGDAWVRRCVVLGLRRAGGDAAEAALEAARGDPDPGVREAVAAALRELRGE
jgi:HEAT repeat protein